MKQRGNIRELTKRGLERAKANGKKLGASREVIARASQKGGRTVAKNADDFAMSLLPVIEEMRERGLSLRAMAGELNNKKVETARGGMWAVTTVKNLIDRLTATGNLKFPSLVKRSPWEEAIRRSIDD
jgi:DNA invertase Pin-like site-specific DNA recombinase